MKLFAVLVLLLLSLNLMASDHIDGPITMQDQQSDLTDLFAFSKKNGNLALVMDSYPFLTNGHFTNKLSYNFVVRKAQITGSGTRAKISTDSSSELKIECRFTGHHETQRVTCKGRGIEVSAKVDTIGKSADGKTLVFAGTRADPFFFSVPWSDSVRFKHELPNKEFDNSVALTNILSIIIEFPVEKAFGPGAGSKFAVVAETVSVASGKRMDRLGRPEITNFSLQMTDDEDQHTELRDKYNQLALFDNSYSELLPFKARLLNRIKKYDELDGKKNWENKPGRLNALTNILLDDFLFVDISVNCQGQDNYFEIEEALLKGTLKRSCGGRKLTDDFVDQQFTLYINAGEGKRIRDGADAPYKKPLNSFPYMAEPDTSIRGAIVRRLGALFGKSLRLKAWRNRWW